MASHRRTATRGVRSRQRRLQGALDRMKRKKYEDLNKQELQQYSMLRRKLGLE